jgi:hypothetical protein
MADETVEEERPKSRVRRPVLATPPPEQPKKKRAPSRPSIAQLQATFQKRKKVSAPWKPIDAKRPVHKTTISSPQQTNLLFGVDETREGGKERKAAALSMMRASCAYFAAEVLTGPVMYAGKYVVADHHIAWDELVVEQKRLAVLAPRDHGKTFFFDFAYPIWKAAFMPNGKGYIFSATQQQAIRILEDIKEEIESNPKLQWLVPSGKKKQWSSTAITLSNGHKIYARGYGTKVRGAHPDWIVVDDGLNDEDAYSERTRQKNIDYFYTAITNMIVPGGQIIVVGTPFHGADLYADLSKNPRYCFRRFQAIDASGKILWAGRYSKARLADKRVEIGSIRFTREYLCEPISDDMSIFPGRLFVGQPTEVFGVCLGMPAKFWHSMGITSLYVGVDFAISSSTSADYTVVFVLGLDSQGNRWVVDIQQHRGLEYQEQLSLINAVGRKYNPDIIFLEANQMQRIFGDELIATSDLPIMKFYTTGTGATKKRSGKSLPKGNTVSQNKNSLEGGVPSLRVLLENKKFRIPRGDAYSVEMTDKWISEMKSFTWADGKLQGVGSHDDMVMACWIADQAIRQSGFSFSTGEDDTDGASLDEILAESMGLDGPADVVTGTDIPENILESVERPDPVLETIKRFSDTAVNGAKADPYGMPRPTPGEDDADERDEDDAYASFNLSAATAAPRTRLPGIRR